MDAFGGDLIISWYFEVWQSVWCNNSFPEVSPEGFSKNADCGGGVLWSRAISCDAEVKVPLRQHLIRHKG